MNPIIFSLLLSFAAASNATWQGGEVVVEGGIVCYVGDSQNAYHNTLEKKSAKKAGKKINDKEMESMKAMDNDAKK